MGYHYDEEQRDQAIADAARRHAKAIDANISEDHKQTLHDIGNALGDRLANNETMGLLIRTARMCNALLVGQMVCDLIQKCIDADAELEAEKEVDRAEQFAKADPDNCRARTRAVAEFRAVAA